MLIQKLQFKKDINGNSRSLAVFYDRWDMSKFYKIVRVVELTGRDLISETGPDDLILPPIDCRLSYKKAKADLMFGL